MRTGLSRVALLCFVISVSAALPAPGADGTIAKKVLKASTADGENLFIADRWRDYEQGAERQDDLIVCDNGTDPRGRRGATQTVVLNQKMPEPFVASVLGFDEDIPLWEKRISI